VEYVRGRVLNVVLKVAGAVLLFWICKPQLRIKILTQRTVPVRNYSRCLITSQRTVWKSVKRVWLQPRKRRFFKLIFGGSENVHESGSDNWRYSSHFCTSKYLVVKRIILPCQHIHNCTWISCNGKSPWLTTS
jgi:hypothetical protein